MVAIRRMVIYFSILTFLISTALAVLFLLFERYILLTVCAGLYVAGILLLLISGRGAHSFVYRIRPSVLELESESGEKETFIREEESTLRLAERSEEKEGDIVKRCFSANRIAARSVVKDSSFKKYVFTCGGRRILLLLDEYAVVLLQRSEK